ncbi:MAG TPA: glycoside hydrolase family 2, partial [Chitinophagaceae bacterium]|nr:glycoside hydrolase family 2 [Chitinophagaceae bacterium]
MRVHRYYILLVLQLAFLLQLSAQETEKVYLSGNGPDDAVSWDFMCTSGMNAGKWTTIPVPSCWELQGFGKYDYGFAKDSVKGKEKGLYKKKFNVPASWKGKVINIVFEGVMTDAEVKINGQSAGPIHQGAFYVFRYEISKYLKFGKENLLEVTVAKHSANESVNAAERRGDFWVFGGIFRPVWLEVLPAIHINEFSIDAKADGLFRVSVWTNDKQNRKSAILRIYDHTDKLVIADTGAAPIANNSEGFIFGKILKDAKAWSPETPYLYKAEVTIFGNGFPLHRVSKKFGFRTVELKPRD